MTNNIDSINSELSSLAKALIRVGNTSEARRVLQITKVASQGAKYTDAPRTVTYDGLSEITQMRDFFVQELDTNDDAAFWDEKLTGSTLYLTSPRTGVNIEFEVMWMGPTQIRVSSKPKDGYVWENDPSVHGEGGPSWVAVIPRDEIPQGRESGGDPDILELGADEPEEDVRYAIAMRKSPHYQLRYYATNKNSFTTIYAVNDYEAQGKVYFCYRPAGSNEPFSGWNTRDEPESLEDMKSIFIIEKKPVGPYGKFTYVVKGVRPAFRQAILQQGQQADDGIVSKAFRKARLSKLAAMPPAIQNIGNLKWIDDAPAEDPSGRETGSSTRQDGPWKAVQTLIRKLNELKDNEAGDLSGRAYSDGWWGEKTAEAYNTLVEPNPPESDQLNARQIPRIKRVLEGKIRALEEAAETPETTPDAARTQIGAARKEALLKYLLLKVGDESGVTQEALTNRSQFLAGDVMGYESAEDDVKEAWRRQAEGWRNGFERNQGGYFEFLMQHYGTLLNEAYEKDGGDSGVGMYLINTSVGEATPEEITPETFYQDHWAFLSNFSNKLDGGEEMHVGMARMTPHRLSYLYKGEVRPLHERESDDRFVSNENAVRIGDSLHNREKKGIKKAIQSDTTITDDMKKRLIKSLQSYRDVQRRRRRMTRIR